jgi:hypothetical protein
LATLEAGVRGVEVVVVVLAVLAGTFLGAAAASLAALVGAFLEAAALAAVAPGRSGSDRCR